MEVLTTSYNNLYDYLIIVGIFFAFYFYTKDNEPTCPIYKHT